MSFADIVAKVAPAVVSIDVTENASANLLGLIPQELSPGGSGGPFGFQFQIPQTPEPQTPIHGTASGFFVSPDGYIVTNNHVVRDAAKITVRTSDDRTLTARVVGQDPDTDIAVLKVAGGPFQFVSFEDRAKPRVGDWVVAVGNPFGLGGSATAGIVSALGRKDLSDSTYVDYMQIDAPINRGNSGGPTFDVDGRVVGVNAAIYTPTGGSVGIGFDIPAAVADRVTKELIATGKVTRGYIGATIQTLSPELAESLGLASQHGAVVAQLSAGGPGARAGLRVGDVITSVNSRPVASSSDLTQQVALIHPGATIDIGLVRDGLHRDVAVRSGLRPSDASLAQNGQSRPAEPRPQLPSPGLLGMQVAPNPDGGLLVKDVAPGSNASDRGVQDGDVLLQAGGRRLQSLADLVAAASDARRAGRKDLALLVARSGSRFFVPVQIAGGSG